MINKMKITCGLLSLGIIIALTIIYVKPEHTQAISAVVTVILTYMIWRIYSRQAAIMEGQKQLLAEQINISKEQTAIARNQAKIQGLLANLEHAPFVVPLWSLESNAWAWLRNNAELQNVGRGCAFETRICGSKIDMIDGCYKSMDAFEKQVLDKQTIPRDEKARTNRNTQPAEYPVDRNANNAVLVIHYKSALGETWHTTVNIDSNSGEIVREEFPAPFIWSPDRWDKLPDVQQYCVFCNRVKSQDSTS